MLDILPPGKKIRSPGGSFVYEIQGPCCILYDRETLPWPCCRLSWRGREPSWNRTGRRFVPDLAASRCPAYSVKACDNWGNTWHQTLIMYHDRLDGHLKTSWYWKGPVSQHPPDFNEKIS